MMIVIPGYKSEKLNLMLHIELCQIGNCIMPQMSLMSTCIISMLLETVHSTNSNKARQDVGCLTSEGGKKKKKKICSITDEIFIPHSFLWLG